MVRATPHVNHNSPWRLAPKGIGARMQWASRTFSLSVSVAIAADNTRRITGPWNKYHLQQLANKNVMVRRWKRHFEDTGFPLGNVRTVSPKSEVQQGNLYKYFTI
jgi:hypothetical protein